MATVMESDTDRTEDTLTCRTEDGVSAVAQLQDVEDRLVALSDRFSVCEQVLKDLKDLSDILVRDSLQDLTCRSQK